MLEVGSIVEVFEEVGEDTILLNYLVSCLDVELLCNDLEEHGVNESVLENVDDRYMLVCITHDNESIGIDFFGTVTLIANSLKELEDMLNTYESFVSWQILPDNLLLTLNDLSY